MRTFITPRQLKTQLEQAAAAISPSGFIRKPKHHNLKEIWCVAHFGIGYERHVAPCTLWVNPEQNSDTDFVLKSDREEFSFQTTLSDVPERRMGDDYKAGPDGKLPVRPYEPGRGTCEGPAWIADAVRKKVSANYSAADKLNVLVYANFPTNGLDYDSVCEALREFSGRFASIWLVTNHQICSVFSTPALGELRGMHLIYEPEELFNAL